MYIPVRVSSYHSSVKLVIANTKGLVIVPDRHRNIHSTCEQGSSVLESYLFPFIVQPIVYLPGLGDIASEEVMVQLLKHKCLPIPVPLYALEVCNLDKRLLQSLDFTVNRFLMNYCQTVFGCELPSALLVKR